jgi:hypothetical protein
MSRHGAETVRVGGALPGGERNPPRRTVMRGIFLWLLGLPIPIIILLYLFHVI